MSLRRLAPRFIDWRLSRIDEEVDRVSCCSSDATTPPSPPLPPPPPLLLDDDDPAPSESSAADAEPSADETPAPPVPDPSPVIYSNADEWRKQQLERRAADDEREALRFIKEKYDSLGKISVNKPSSGSVTSPAVPVQQQHNILPDEQHQTAALYENTSPAVDTGAAAAENHCNVSESVECVECSSRTALNSASASQPVTRSVSKQPPAPAAATVQHRELKPAQRQRPVPPCQCHQHHHHHQQQQQLEMLQQRQRLHVSECIPRSPLSDGELTQIDLFYRSYKSSVYVCTCMATLSFSRPVLTAAAKSKLPAKLLDEYDDGVWACVRTGIPVIVRDDGDGRRRRRVCVLLAERGTGFELWRAPLDRLSDYTVTAGSGQSASVSCSQHTMRLSVDDRMSVTARLVFDDQAAADEFHRQLVQLATAAADDATTAPSRGGGGGQAKKKRHHKGVAAISKTDISQPCCFSHVTRLERGIACRGRPGLHIVVATACQTLPLAAESTPPPPPPSSNLATDGHRHSSFKTSR